MGWSGRGWGGCGGGGRILQDWLPLSWATVAPSFGLHLQLLPQLLEDPLKIPQGSLKNFSGSFKAYQGIPGIFGQNLKTVFKFKNMTKIP